jgi:uncharacterized repeat protein (TIGR03803 family)
MTNRQRHRIQILGMSPCASAFAVALAIAFALTLAAAPAQAQTYKVIYNFTGGADGAGPAAGLTIDKAGNLYGTTSSGGGSGLDYGTVFKLAPRGSGWVLTPLYSFAGGSDGEFPVARVAFGPNGSLYGTTPYGGESGCQFNLGCGVVFNLRPPAAACKTALCPWSKTNLYEFTGGSDGGNPGYGDLVFDQAGNLYGTTSLGGLGIGVVYELVPSGGGWTQNVLYSLGSGSGYGPEAGVLLDKAGNLYSTCLSGCGGSYGAVFELSPSGSGWTETALRVLQPLSDGAYPVGGLISDSAGNLYGTTSWAGPYYGGTVFELSPSNGSWTFTALYDFVCNNCVQNSTVRTNFSSGWNPQGIKSDRFAPSPGPQANLVMDAAGNLYGTTYQDGANRDGNVFKLTPSNGGWIYTSLHDFTCGSGNDGCSSGGTPVLDANGNLYGTAGGGAYGDGVIWEITP